MALLGGVYGATAFAHNAGKPLTGSFVICMRVWACGAALPFLVFWFLGFCWRPRFRIGLLALPLCGAAVTFFAAAKKVTKESRF
ncbi:hypothetical protein [Paraburkholderia azotifigens]|uniref:Uncharacterized protein n=1 Tax=Paraburkholderia azotifigens TaxID=2057004 RepID=A0ABU9R649_9BURK